MLKERINTQENLGDKDNVLNVFLGYEIILDDFKEVLLDRIDETLVVELMSNQRIVTMQWYNELEVDYNDKYISLNQTDEEKSDTNIWINEIEEILEGYSFINDNHWLVRLKNGLEYFIYKAC